jgi:hypothetical protein
MPMVKILYLGCSNGSLIALDEAVAAAAAAGGAVVVGTA